MDLTLVSLGIGIGVPFILLYERKKKWCSDKLRWILTGILFLTGIITTAVIAEEKPDGVFYFLCVPFAYNCFDRWFKYLSIKKKGRDFYLWLSNSDEIDDRLFAKNPHVKTLDKVFSLLLLLIIMGLMVVGASIFSKK